MSKIRGVLKVFIFPCFTEIPVFNANSVDTAQTSSSVASDLGLHCLPMSLFWDARLKWGIETIFLFGPAVSRIILGNKPK